MPSKTPSMSRSDDSDGPTPNKLARRQSSLSLSGGTSGLRPASQTAIRKSPSGKIMESRSSLTSFHYSSSGSKSNLTAQSWVPGQEFSNIGAYDPVEDIIYAYQYASNRKDLKFRQVFRYTL